MRCSSERCSGDFYQRSIDGWKERTQEEVSPNRRKQVRFKADDDDDDDDDEDETLLSHTRPKQKSVE
ncbi:uncharacterized protein V6R79_023711 [Siganus canaliculatus]